MRGVTESFHARAGVRVRVGIDIFSVVRVRMRVCTSRRRAGCRHDGDSSTRRRCIMHTRTRVPIRTSATISITRTLTTRTMNIRRQRRIQQPWMQKRVLRYSLGVPDYSELVPYTQYDTQQSRDKGGVGDAFHRLGCVGVALANVGLPTSESRSGGVA